MYDQYENEAKMGTFSSLIPIEKETVRKMEEEEQRRKEEEKKRAK